MSLMGSDAPPGGEAASRERSAARGSVWKPWTEGGMWPFGVVVRHPFGENLAQMPFVRRNDPVGALAPRGADQPFAIRVRLRRARGGGRRTLSDIDLSASSTASEKMASQSWMRNFQAQSSGRMNDAGGGAR